MDRIPSRGGLDLPARAVCLALLLALSVVLGAPERALADPPDPDHLRTLGLVSAYQNAPNWVVKSMALLSLGERWHPAGTCVVLDALRSDDPRLRAFAIETLRSTSGEALRAVLSADLMSELIENRLEDKNKYVHAYVLSILTNAFPVFGKKSLPWAKWWKGKQLDYVPAA